MDILERSISKLYIDTCMVSLLIIGIIYIVEKIKVAAAIAIIVIYKFLHGFYTSFSRNATS